MHSYAQIDFEKTLYDKTYYYLGNILNITEYGKITIYSNQPASVVLFIITASDLKHSSFCLQKY